MVRTLLDHVALEPRLDLIHHSPPGFDWAASGSATGSAQLALALLAHASGDDRFARKHYQAFAHEFITRLPKFKWELTALQILQSLEYLNGAQLTTCAPNRRKKAVIRALVPTEADDKVIEVHGYGRSVRRASTRALLNLLGNEHLKRRRITSLQIELSVTNTAEAKIQSASSSW